MQSVHMQSERVSVFICSVHILGCHIQSAKSPMLEPLPPPWRFESRRKLYMEFRKSVLCIALLFGWHCLLYVMSLDVSLGSFVSLEVSLGSF
jgi:hypothetical protein